jgi:hypothetical protein
VSVTPLTRDTDKVVHIMGTYGLPLQPEVLDTLREDMRASKLGRHNRLAEEDAAIYLARSLHAMVMADQCACVGTSTIDGIHDAWAKFTQQAMYRADLGLINMVLFDHEILPLIDDVERILPPDLAAPELSPPAFTARRPGVAP